MEGNTMATSKDDAPYSVGVQEYEHTYRDDGTTGGMWTVHIHHNNGTVTQVRMPEEHYSAEAVHTLAMAQHAEIARVAALPGSVTGA